MTGDEKTPEQPGADVVHLRADRFRLHTGRKDREKPTCFHSGTVLVDFLARTLECAACGAQIDPMSELNKIAREADWTLSMRAEKKKLEQELEALKVQIRGAKATKKRAVEQSERAQLVEACAVVADKVTYDTRVGRAIRVHVGGIEQK